MRKIIYLKAFFEFGVRRAMHLTLLRRRLRAAWIAANTDSTFSWVTPRFDGLKTHDLSH